MGLRRAYFSDGIILDAIIYEHVRHGLIAVQSIAYTCTEQHDLC